MPPTRACVIAHYAYTHAHICRNGEAHNPYPWKAISLPPWKALCLPLVAVLRSIRLPLMPASARLSLVHHGYSVRALACPWFEARACAREKYHEAVNTLGKAIHIGRLSLVSVSPSGVHEYDG